MNEPKVFELLERRGFAFVEDVPRTVASQIGIFSCAEIIVAPHGGALTNLLWSSPGTHVIELFSPHYQPPFYQELSKVVGLRYQSISKTGSNSQHWTAMGTDFEVDLGALEERVDLALAPDSGCHRATPRAVPALRRPLTPGNESPIAGPHTSPSAF